MRNFYWARAAQVVGGFAAVLIIGGCAGIGGDHRAGIDVESMINAIAQDDAAYVQAAVNRGAISVNQRLSAPAYSAGAPLVALAARDGSLQVLRYLIAAGADLNARTPVNETPLMLAAYFSGDDGRSDRHDAALRLLVEAGASLENVSHNYTALAYAAYNNRQRALRYLLERGARVDADASERLVYVNTPLMMAAIQGHREAVGLLLRAGADPLIRVRDGNTAREFASKYRHTHVEPLLACAEAIPSGMRYAQHCEGPSVATSH
ncbi:MAG: ankyrin repeat domain-containing protein [Burkholderiales bacterium]|nr:ankyrin repeat domain-containing protein [Burkholderiales bacterium]